MRSIKNRSAHNFVNRFALAAPQGHAFENGRVARGAEIVHYFRASLPSGSRRQRRGAAERNRSNGREFFGDHKFQVLSLWVQTKNGYFIRRRRQIVSPELRHFREGFRVWRQACFTRSSTRDSNSAVCCSTMKAPAFNLRTAIISNNGLPGISKFLGQSALKKYRRIIYTEMGAADGPEPGCLRLKSTLRKCRQFSPGKAQILIGSIRVSVILQDR